MKTSIWPRALFAATLIAVFSLGLLSLFYFQSLAKLELQSQAITEVRTQYEKRINDLQKKLVIEQTQTVKIPTQVTTQRCDVKTTILGISIGGSGGLCFPQTQTVDRDVQQVVKVEDPKIRAELDGALVELKKLSDENIIAKSVVDQLTPYYDLAQKLMKPIISIIVLIASLYIILSNSYKADQEKWAFGSLGTILGFWLK
jgi:hypothetical protein